MVCAPKRHISTAQSYRKCAFKWFWHFWRHLKAAEGHTKPQWEYFYNEMLKLHVRRIMNSLDECFSSVQKPTSSDLLPPLRSCRHVWRWRDHRPRVRQRLRPGEGWLRRRRRPQGRVPLHCRPPPSPGTQELWSHEVFSHHSPDPPVVTHRVWPLTSWVLQSLTNFL